MCVDEITSVCVVGAGTMGGQVAHQIALSGLPVRLVGRSPHRLERAVEDCGRLLQKRVEKGKLTGDELEACRSRLRITTDLEEGACGADLVIETIVEDREAKAHLFTALGHVAPPEAVLASNSSTMPSSFFVHCVPDPSRLLNVHFFNPALLMQLVEVVRGPHTSEQAMACALGFTRRIGRTPVPVRRESFGFIVNRILFIALREAFGLVEGGVCSVEGVDLAVRGGLGWPLGPFALADLVGLDVTADILAEGAAQTGEERWAPPRLLTDLVERGALGRKAGRGFLDYTAEHHGHPTAPGERVVDGGVRPV